jgi:hypothetical protein
VRAPALFESRRDEAFVVPWDWHELQIDDTEPRPGKARSGEILVVEQHFGRKLELARFHQYPTHGGLLIGIAQARDSMVEEAIRTARDLFGEGDGVAQAAAETSAPVVLLLRRPSAGAAAPRHDDRRIEFGAGAGI